MNLLLFISRLKAGVICTILATGILFPQLGYEDSWAVIIGINDYENDNITDLNYAISDAEGIKKMLMEYYGFPEKNITSLLNKEATALNIKKEISELAKKTKDKDRIVIFFAGHGMTEDIASGGEMGYLIPYDGDLENLYLTAVPMKELKNLSDRFDARHVLFLVDACYGGLAAVGTRGLSTKVAGYYDKIFRGKARQIITAGGKGETVLEKAEWGHSAFTYNLLRGLKDWMADLDNDGYITGEELGIYLKRRVTEDSELHQTPTTGRFSTDQGEFMFSRPEQLGGRITNDDVASASQSQAEILKMREENAELVAKLAERPARSLSTGKKLSFVYPGMGHFYMGQKKKGLLWSAAGTLSLVGVMSTYSNYTTRTDEFNIANEYYLSTGKNKQDQITTSENKQKALSKFIGATAVYTGAVIFNYFNLNSLNKEAYSSSPLRGGINPKGEIVISFSF